MKIFHLCICFLFMSTVVFSQSESQLRKLLRQFPAADTNGDGKLTAEEARAFMASRSRRGAGQGPPMKFHVDQGWSKVRFPDNAVCYMTPAEIQALYRKVYPKDTNPVFQVPKPEKALRIVGTGHSFMAPGYRTFPVLSLIHI